MARCWGGSGGDGRRGARGGSFPGRGGGWGPARPGARVWLLLALPGIAALHLLLKRALDILATVQAGSPFVLENAGRLRTIAWCLLAMQVTDLALGAASQVVAAAHARIDWDFSLVGW